MGVLTTEIPAAAITATTEAGGIGVVIIVMISEARDLATTIMRSTQSSVLTDGETTTKTTTRR